MLNIRAFRIPTQSIIFYVLAGMAPVRERYSPFDNYERDTPLGTMIITHKGYPEIWCETYFYEARMKQGQYFEIKDVDSKFYSFIEWSVYLKGEELKTVLDEYDTIREKCFTFIKENKVMTLKDIEEHVPFLKKIKEYALKVYQPEDVAEWVV